MRCVFGERFATEAGCKCSRDDDARLLLSPFVKLDFLVLSVGNEIGES